MSSRWTWLRKRLGDAGFSGEEALQVDGPARTVDTRQPQDAPSRGEGDLLGRDENAGRFPLGLGGRVFRHRRTIGLAVDARAAREEQGHTRKGIGEIPRPSLVDAPVGIGSSAPAGTRAVNDEIGKRAHATGRSEGEDGGSIAHVEGDVCASRDRLSRAACGDHIVPNRCECACKRRTRVTGSDEKDVHGRWHGIRADAHWSNASPAILVSP